MPEPIPAGPGADSYACDSVPEPSPTGSNTHAHDSVPEPSPSGPSAQPQAPKSRARRDVDLNIEHPTFPRRSALNEYDRRVLTNPKPADLQDWRRNMLRRNDPVVDSRSGSVIMSKDYPRRLEEEGWVKCPRIECRADAVFQSHAVKTGGLYMSLVCTKCGIKCVDDLIKSVDHSKP